MSFALSTVLPADWRSARLLGRVDLGAGPTPVLIDGGTLYDLTPSAATVSAAIARRQWLPEHGKEIAALDPDVPALPEGASLLSPIDLQCIKAAGVTFAVSAIERVIEERARGDASQAANIRAGLELHIGQGIRSVVPGSA